MNEIKDALKPKIMKYFCVVSIWYDRYFYKTLTAEEIEMYKNNGYKVNVQALRIVH